MARSYGGQGNDIVAHVAGGIDGIGGSLLEYGGSKGSAQIFGGVGDDIVLGVGGRLKLVGGNGNDIVGSIGGTNTYLLGGNDEDLLVSLGSSNDRLQGGNGDDILAAIEGIALMIGGSGADDFAFFLGSSGAHHVRDFDVSEDQIAFVSPRGGMSAEETFHAFMTFAEQRGSQVVFDDGDQVIRLRNVNIDDLSMANFQDSTIVNDLIDSVPFWFMA